MRLVTICLILLLSLTAQSQKKTFIRIFDKEGVRIAKGHLESLSDSFLVISMQYGVPERIPVNRIATIKVKRSFGHGVVLSSVVLGGAFMIIGIASADPDSWFGWTAGEGAAGGLLIGSATGAFVSSIVSGTVKRPVFKVDMSPEQWMKVKDALTIFLPKPKGNH